MGVERVWGDAPAAPGGLEMGVANKLGLDIVRKRGQRLLGFE
jgi:hypothetical protein